MTDRLDLRVDLHGRVADYISANDRIWFAHHPGESFHHRPATAHEFCDPRAAAAGMGCINIVDKPDLAPGHNAELWVEVEQITEGMRFRRAYWVIYTVKDAA